MTARTDALMRGLDGPPTLYDAVMSEGKRAYSTPPPETGFRRLVSWLPVALMLAAFLIVVSGVRFAVFPEPVRIDRGNRVDVYSWEGLVAFVLFTVGSLGMALTIKFDPLAPPETVMFRRSARWIGWFMGVGGWIGVWRLARVLLGKAPPP